MRPFRHPGLRLLSALEFPLRQPPLSALLLAALGFLWLQNLGRWLLLQR
jgi:hypothetical protein